MEGLKVQCPNCKRKDFITTDKYDPAAIPNGSMVKCLLSYQIDWLMSSTTLCSEMTCPECLAQLAPSGRLNVVVTPREAGEVYRALFPDEIPLNSFPPGENRIRIPMEEAPTETVIEKAKLLCPVCNDGREFKSQIALNGHMKKHERGK